MARRRQLAGTSTSREVARTLGWRRALTAGCILAALIAVLSPSQASAAQPNTNTYCANPNTTIDTCYGTAALANEGGNTYSSAFGYNALYSNTTGGDNTAAGADALEFNTAGSDNTAAGEGALFSNTTGSNNTAAGYFALSGNSKGSYNTAAGTGALESNTSGSYNTATGGNALAYNTGYDNTAAGADALEYNTSGGGNTAAGEGALYANTTGGDNTASGSLALQANTTGASNTASGYYALYDNTTGANNTALGYYAGDASNGGSANTTGSNNTFIGYQSGPGTSTQLTDATAIGENALVSENNALALGGTGPDAVNVGVGTATPDQALQVVGNVHVSGTGNGIIFPDGSVQTTASTGGGLPSGQEGNYLRYTNGSWQASNILSGDIPAGSANYIQNSTSQQVGADFNIDGNGTLGGTLTAGKVAIGTSGGSGTLLQVGVPSNSYGSYPQIPVVTSNSAPPGGDCSAATAGRFVFQYSAGKGTVTLWACAPNGSWKIAK